MSYYRISEHICKWARCLQIRSISNFNLVLEKSNQYNTKKPESPNWLRPPCQLVCSFTCNLNFPWIHQLQRQIGVVQLSGTQDLRLAAPSLTIAKGSLTVSLSGISTMWSLPPHLLLSPSSIIPTRPSCYCLSPLGPEISMHRQVQQFSDSAHHPSERQSTLCSAVGQTALYPWLRCSVWESWPPYLSRSQTCIHGARGLIGEQPSHCMRMFLPSLAEDKACSWVELPGPSFF